MDFSCPFSFVWMILMLSSHNWPSHTWCFISFIHSIIYLIFICYRLFFLTGPTNQTSTKSIQVASCAFSSASTSHRAAMMSSSGGAGSSGAGSGTGGISRSIRLLVTSNNDDRWVDHIFWVKENRFFLRNSNIKMSLYIYIYMYRSQKGGKTKTKSNLKFLKKLEPAIFV